MSGKTITIVSVTGHQDYAQGAVYAIERSYEELQKKLPKETLTCLLVSPEQPSYLPSYIKHSKCKPFSYLEYNLFVLYLLDDLIDTDFALIVQNDGFVVDGHNWRDEFFDYDFIGAPLYHLCEQQADGHVRIQGGQMHENLDEEMPENHFEGQNGGFSLRSKRLLGLPRAHDMKVSLTIPKALTQGSVLQISYGFQLHNEDIWLTVLNRQELEKKGIRFAPPRVSTYFACESTIVHYKRKIDLQYVLGCHVFGLLVLKDKNTVYMQKKMNFINHDPTTNQTCRWLLDKNMQLSVPKPFLEK